MKINAKKYRPRGFLMVDLMVALALLTLAIVPLGYSFAREQQALKIEYYRSLAGEIVDGELEILAAGAARELPDGPQAYPIHARAAESLPPGQFQLTKTGKHLQLEWNAETKSGIGTIRRETSLP